MTTRTAYAEAISKATGHTDSATLALVEDLMRINLTALDHLTATEFAMLACQSLADAKALDEMGELRPYCEAVGTAAPSWSRL